jgi:hypothetical protein
VALATVQGRMNRSKRVKEVLGGVALSRDFDCSPSRSDDLLERAVSSTSFTPLLLFKL